MPRLTAADTALHDGDAGPRKAIWSEHDPVTLFGAALSTTGSKDVMAVFDWLGSRFSDCKSFEYEVEAADASGDLAYIVGTERTTAAIDGAEPRSYSLRVTTIFRHEDGEWKVVHRHADPEPDSAGTTDQVERLRPGKAGERT